MKTFVLAAALLALAAACRRPGTPSPPKADGSAAGVTMIDYRPADGAYGCRAPARWRTDEESAWGPAVTFLDPDGPRPYSHSISILRYPGKADSFTSAAQYLKEAGPEGADAGPVVKTTEDGLTLYRYHETKPFRSLNGRTVLYQLRDDVVLLPVKGGFYRLTHSAPDGEYLTTLPVFEALVKSFRPKG